MDSIHKQPITAKLASQSCVSSHLNQEVKIILTKRGGEKEGGDLTPKALVN